MITLNNQSNYIQVIIRNLQNQFNEEENNSANR